MGNKQTFTTIVLHAENLELRKDPGQIPYHFGNLKNVDSTLVTYYYSNINNITVGPLEICPQKQEDILKDYPFLSTEVKGLKIKFLDYLGRGKFYEKAVYKYLKENSKNIDVLNLFHFTTENIFYSLLYKIKNPKGKIYLKLDINVPFYESCKYFFNANVMLPFIKRDLIQKILYPLFFKIVNTISAESAYGLNYFKSRFNVPENKLILIPNGIDDDLIKSKNIKPLTFAKKENILITVGKIGSAEKNNKMLLDALANVDLKNWKIYFIGSITNDFKPEIESFYNKNPGLINAVVFTGRINEPEKLYDYYNRAKIFCLTSINEGFPLAACEAAYFGNYLILTSTIKCFNELTDNGKYGNSVLTDDYSTLSKNIQNLIDNESVLERSCQGMMNYAKTTLTWQSIIPLLQQRLINHN